MTASSSRLVEQTSHSQLLVVCFFFRISFFSWAFYFPNTLKYIYLLPAVWECSLVSFSQRNLTQRGERRTNEKLFVGIGTEHYEVNSIKFIRAGKWTVTQHFVLLHSYPIDCLIITTSAVFTSHPPARFCHFAASPHCSWSILPSLNNGQFVNSYRHLRLPSDMHCREILWYRILRSSSLPLISLPSTRLLSLW